MRGGEFLINDLSPREAVAPEDITDDHKMVRETLRKFIAGKIVPNIARMEKDHDWQLTRSLIKELGDLGILSIDFPEDEGGLGRDKLMALVVAEALTAYESFAVSVGAHIGIGTWPLKLFGTALQKEKYLSKLLNGELVAAYALTEPQTGSDALNLRTTATLAPDGEAYILNGAKMWISNAGFADIFTVYAKIPGSGGSEIAAFLVERRWPGVEVGKDEPKTGLWGSSTCALSFTDVRVPKENLLGTPGKGHKIAFNVLNLGRFKLAAGCVGTLRVTLDEALAYAKERQAFGKPIASFGAIREKLANMAIRLFVGESTVYRLANDLGAIEQAAKSPSELIQSVEEYSAECALLKVLLSEMAYASCDDEVQIFGGYGFSREYPADRRLRDSRVNRIFEGTNEINAMLAVEAILKLAMKGQLPLLQAFGELTTDEINTDLLPNYVPQEYKPLYKLLCTVKRSSIFLLGSATQKYMLGLRDEQGILLRLSKLLESIYSMESTFVRLLKLPENDREYADAVVRAYFACKLEEIKQVSYEIASAVFDKDDDLGPRKKLSDWLAHTPVNVIGLKRKIAEIILNS